MACEPTDPIPLSTARRAAVRVLRGLSSHPDVLRLGVQGALRRMEPRVPAVEIFATTLEPAALREGRIEAALAALDGMQDGRMAPGLPVHLTVAAEADFRPPTDPTPPPGTVAIEQIRGAFHLHVAPGRGQHGVDRLAARVAQEGYAWAVASLPSTRADALEALQGFRAADGRPRIFAALEATIGPDGRLPEGPDDVPWIAGAAPTAAATAAGLSDPRVKVLAHPPETPGAWHGREADDVGEWEQVLTAAAARGVALEFSGAARAAWLPDLVLDLARRLGVAVLPGADAEAPNDIDDLLCAVGSLRLAGWPAEAVPATRTAEAFAAWWCGKDAG